MQNAAAQWNLGLDSENWIELDWTGLEDRHDQ